MGETMLTKRLLAWIRWGLVATILTSGGKFAIAAEPTSAKATKDRLCKVEGLCRACPNAGCTMVVEEAAWPTNPLQAGLEIRNALATLVVPSPEWIESDPKGGWLLRYSGPRKALTMDWMMAEAFGVPKAKARDASESAPSLGFSDIPRIQFTQTVEDAEPKGEADRRIWRHGLMAKNIALQDAKQLFHAKRGSLSVWIADGGPGERTLNAYLVHSKQKDRYLHVQAFGFDFEEFKNILASARPPEGL